MILKRITDRFKGKNSQTLAKNFSSLAILQVLRYIIPLIVLPYVTPIIGLEHFGEIAIAASFTSIVQVFVNYSFGFMGARDVARNKGNDVKLSSVLSTTLFSYLIIYFIALFVSAGVVLIVPKFRSIWLLIAISLTIPLFSSMVFEWFFQGVERMHNITIVNFLSRIVFVALVFGFIKKESDYLLYPLFNSIGFFIAAVYSLVVIRSRYKCKVSIPTFSDVVSYIKQGKDIFLNQSCLSIFARMPNILLGVVSGSSEAGIYDSAARLQEAGQHGMDVLNRTFFPFLAVRMDKHRQYRKINLVLVSLVAILLFVFAPLLVHILYAPEFAPSVAVLRLLSISVFFIGISNAYSVNHLLLIGKEVLVRNITLLFSALGLVLLLIMIYYRGAIGAAIAMTFMNASLALAFYLASKRVDSVIPNNDGSKRE